MDNTKLAKTTVGLTVSIICLYVFSRNINLKEIANLVIFFEKKQIFFGMVCLSIGYLIRIYRWRFILKIAGYHPKLSVTAAAFLGSIALNNIFPLRAGDLFRTFVFSSCLNISKSVSAGSLITEKIFDLLIIALFLSLSAFYVGFEDEEFQNINDMVFSAIFIIVISFVFLWLIWAVNGKYKILQLIGYFASTAIGSKLLSSFEDILRLFIGLKSLKILLKVTGYSAAVWIFESGLYYFILVGLGHPLCFIEAMLVMCVCTLATLIPSSPGYFGTFHLAAFGSISLFGLSDSIASLSALAIHICLWAPTTIAGLAGIVTCPELLKSLYVKKDQKKRSN